MSMLKNPNDSSNEEKEDPSYTPHLEGKWLKESPWTGFLLFDRSNYDESRFHVRLSEVHDPCAVCSNGNISHSCIIFLSCKMCPYISNHVKMFLHHILRFLIQIRTGIPDLATD